MVLSWLQPTFGQDIPVAETERRILETFPVRKIVANHWAPAKPINKLEAYSVFIARLFLSALAKEN